MNTELRGDSSALLEFARRAYSSGATMSQVIQLVYGVDLPAEAYAFFAWYRAHRLENLDLSLTWQPWVLMALSPEWVAGEPSLDGESDVSQDDADDGDFFADKVFLPLMRLHVTNTALQATHDGCVIGYSLESLHRGDSRILGFDFDVWVHRGGSPSWTQHLFWKGDALVDVLRQWARSYRDLAATKHDAYRQGKYSRQHTRDGGLARAKQELETAQRLHSLMNTLPRAS
jgi:hypothetical protein